MVKAAVALVILARAMEAPVRHPRTRATSIIREQLTPAQLDYLARAREFVTAEVQPVINGHWERAESGGR